MGTKKKKKPDQMSVFGETIWDAMETLGWNQDELERKSGVSQSTINRLLNCPDHFAKTNVGAIINLCKALQIPFPHSADFFDQKITLHLYDLDVEDKKTLLRLILRMKHSAEKANDLLRHLLKPT